MKPRCNEAAEDRRLTLAEVFRQALPEYSKRERLPLHHWKVLRAIVACRTPALGGHLFHCCRCGKEHFVPHSCRNRHCPTCQGANGFDWLEKQAELLLPIPYFHLVFTLPHDLNPLIQQNRAVCYKLLFDAASATLLEFGRNELGAQIGVTAVLHTWSQTLLDHYHLHCIVTGGGLKTDGKEWKGTSRHWLFPVHALAKVFRGKFMAGLAALYESGKLEFHGQLHSMHTPDSFKKLLRQACRHSWVVYAKRPFAGPNAVLAYLSRYTHRVGITNHRLRTLNARAQTVTFDYKDYADEAKRKLMTLTLDEFVRRFRLHILPEHFVKIRHYGLLANRNRHTRVAQARTALGVRAALPKSPEINPKPDLPDGSQSLPLCPYCRQPGLILLKITHASKTGTYDSS